MGFAPHVGKSTDRGRTWVSLAAGLPAEHVNTVRQDPKAARGAIAKTTLRVKASKDEDSEEEELGAWCPVTESPLF